MAASLQDTGISKHSVPTGTALTAIIVFISLAFNNVVELNILTFYAFKHRKSLYFWSFVVATWGIALHQIGFLIKDLGSPHGYLYTTLICIGWYGMVTGQSCVLYSRLHIVMQSRKILRAVLAMIIVDAIICHVPITVMVYGANTADPEPFVVPYSIYEKFQVTIFFIQEFVISGLYIWETLKIMRLEGSLQVSQRTRRVMSHLLYVNVLIIILDTTVLGLEYAGLYTIQTAYKGFAYSVKLKLEFSILNRLVETMKSSRNPSSFSSSAPDTRIAPSNTMELDRPRRSTMEVPGTGIQYQTYIRAESHRGNPRRQQSGKGVVKTTEVLVSRDRDMEDTGGDIGLGNIEVTSDALEGPEYLGASSQSRGLSSSASGSEV